MTRPETVWAGIAGGPSRHWKKQRPIGGLFDELHETELDELPMQRHIAVLPVFHRSGVGSYPCTLLGDTRSGFVGVAPDASDQTVNATNSPIIDAYNVLVRAGFAATTGPQVSGILDYNAVAMYPANPQKFMPGWSADGLHLAGSAWRRAAAAVTGRDLLLTP